MISLSDDNKIVINQTITESREVITEWDIVRLSSENRHVLCLLQKESPYGAALQSSSEVFVTISIVDQNIHLN